MIFDALSSPNFSEGAGAGFAAAQGLASFARVQRAQIASKVSIPVICMKHQMLKAQRRATAQIGEATHIALHHEDRKNGVWHAICDIAESQCIGQQIKPRRQQRSQRNGDQGVTGVGDQPVHLGKNFRLFSRAARGPSDRTRGWVSCRQSWPCGWRGRRTR